MASTFDSLTLFKMLTGCGNVFPKDQTTEDAGLQSNVLYHSYWPSTCISDMMLKIYNRRQQMESHDSIVHAP